MVEFIVGFVVGGFTGWVVLEKPQWAKDLWAKVVERFNTKT